MMFRFLFFLSVVTLSISCNRTNLKYDKPYFDFDSLINTQVQALVQAEVSLSKTVMLDDQGDQSIINIDSAKIANELDVFRQLDVINKPLYRDVYEIIDGEKDSRSNLLVRKYKSKKPAPVPFVNFYYANDFLHIKKIESSYIEDNTLYSAKRMLQLEFDNDSGRLLLTRYVVTGTQKMILTDSVKFSIVGSFIAEEQ
jgi:putative sterol carrier protein